MPFKHFLTLLRTAAVGLLMSGFGRAADTPRRIIAQAVLEEDDEKKNALIRSLVGQVDSSIKPLLAAWKGDLIFLHKADGGATIPVLLSGDKDAAETQAAIRLDDASQLKDAAGKHLRLTAADLDPAEHNSVVGGVGNIMGTVISALSIGVLDQSLQQILRNPVLGKILVLLGIILFLQWRPAGLFVTKSRSLEG